LGQILHMKKVPFHKSGRNYTAKFYYDYIFTYMYHRYQSSGLYKNLPVRNRRVTVRAACLDELMEKSGLESAVKEIKLFVKTSLLLALDLLGCYTCTQWLQLH